MTDRFTREREMHEAMQNAIAQQNLPEIEILDVEYDERQNHVRLFVENQNGSVDHRVCTEVSRAVRDLAGDCSLEVSSPGIEPPIRTVHRFQQAVGRNVRFRVQGSKRYQRGVIESADENGVEFVREDGDSVTVDWHDLVRCFAQSEGSSK